VLPVSRQLHADPVAMRKAFDLYDSNGDGKITLDEVRHVMTKIEERYGDEFAKMGDQELIQLFQRVDKNGARHMRSLHKAALTATAPRTGNNEIEFDEFKEVFALKLHLIAQEYAVALPARNKGERRSGVTGTAYAVGARISGVINRKLRRGPSAKVDIAKIFALGRAAQAHNTAAQEGGANRRAGPPALAHPAGTRPPHAEKGCRGAFAQPPRGGRCALMPLSLRARRRSSEVVETSAAKYRWALARAAGAAAAEEPAGELEHFRGSQHEGQSPAGQSLDDRINRSAARPERPSSAPKRLSAAR
jgi:hypothetical protein